MQLLQSTLKNYEADLTSLRQQISEFQVMNSQLQDQNILLKAQLGAANSLKRHQLNQSTDASVDPSLKAPTTNAHNLIPKISNIDITGQNQSQEELTRLRKDQDDLLELLAEQVCLFLFKKKIFKTT